MPYVHFSSRVEVPNDTAGRRRVLAALVALYDRLDGKTG